MNLERTEMILKTIDQLGMVTVKQLHEILEFGTYRNTCRVINRLSSYLNVIRSKQKIVYLNEAGRNMIGSKKEMKKTQLMDHILLTNDVYIYFSSPVDWKREYLIEVKNQNEYDFGIKVKGLTTSKKKIIPDALFTRNGYIHLVEIDNTRSMQDNKKKIEKYADLWPE